MTTWPKYNQTVSSSALPSRLPAGLRQLGAPQWMFPTDALWKCLSFGCIYYILIQAHWMKWWHIADRSNFRGWYMWSGAGPVLKTHRDEKKSHLISSQGTVLSSHMLVYEYAAQGHARPRARTFSQTSLWSFARSIISRSPNSAQTCLVSTWHEMI